VSTNRSETAFARGLQGGIFTAAVHCIGQECIERDSELPSSIADQKPKQCGAITEIHQKDPELLHDPSRSLPPTQCTPFPNTTPASTPTTTASRAR
jgi:hypothetical protein